MCKRCDGYSWDEIERAEDLQIMVDGYLVLQVVDSPDNVWSYTVGLSESFDHPELICFDLDGEVQHQMIRHLAEQVLRSGKIDELTIGAGEVELVPVHRSHLASDLVASWTNRYERVAEHGEFLQIVPDQLQFCPNHGPEIRLFDRKEIRKRGRAGRNSDQR